MTTLSTWLLTGSTLVTLCIALWAIRIAVYSAKLAQFCQEELDDRSKLGPKEAEFAQLQVDMTDLADKVGGIGESVRKLRSRQGMRKHRAALANGDDSAPDWRTDPAGYKAYMRKQLHQKR